MTSTRTERLAVDGGTIAYELSGSSGPLVVLAHGMGDSREAYRFLVPGLTAAGYRVANVDLRGCGESSTGWASYSRTDIAGDLLALVQHLGGPAVLVGHSIAGGAVTIAASTAPAAVTSLVEIAPFTRGQSVSLSDLLDRDFRRGLRHLAGAVVLGRTRSWRKYLDLAFPGARPADHDARLDQITAMLAEPGRTEALRAMGRSAPTDAGAHLGGVTCPVLVVQGEADPDWSDPQAEGEAILAALPPGLGRLAMVPGSGHYPHVQHPAEVLELVLPFLAATTQPQGTSGGLRA